MELPVTGISIASFLKWFCPNKRYCPQGGENRFLGGGLEKNLGVTMVSGTPKVIAHSCMCTISAVLKWRG